MAKLKLKYQASVPLSEFLRSTRERVGLSQLDVATQLGYTSAQFISNWERGLSNPPPQAVKILASVFHLNADDFFEFYLEHSKQRLESQLRSEFYKHKKTRN